MTQIKTAFGCIVCLALFGAILAVAVEPYKCVPYTPKYECDLSRYEVRLHDITEPGRRLIGLAEGACVYVVGHGKARRLVMHDASFHAANREDFFDRVEFPAAQATVCEIK